MGAHEPLPLVFQGISRSWNLNFAGHVACNPSSDGRETWDSVCVEGVGLQSVTWGWRVAGKTMGVGIPVVSRQYGWDPREGCSSPASETYAKSIWNLWGFRDAAWGGGRTIWAKRSVDAGQLRSSDLVLSKPGLPALNSGALRRISTTTGGEHKRVHGRTVRKTY
jgi:hypothetical protein